MLKSKKRFIASTIITIITIIASFVVVNKLNLSELISITVKIKDINIIPIIVALVIGCMPAGLFSGGPLFDGLAEFKAEGRKLYEIICYMIGSVIGKIIRSFFGFVIFLFCFPIGLIKLIFGKFDKGENKADE